MLAAGFQYVEGLSPAASVAEDPRRTLSAEEFAAQFGLGVTAYDLGLIPFVADPNLEYRSSLSASQLDSYIRTETSCSGADDPEQLSMGNALAVAVQQFRESIAADDRMVAAVGTWSGCLAASGFQFGNPQEMLESFYTRMNSRTGEVDLRALFDEEVAVAVANVACFDTYTATYRDVVLARFAQFEGLLATAIASGSAPDAQG